MAPKRPRIVRFSDLRVMFAPGKTLIIFDDMSRGNGRIERGILAALSKDDSLDTYQLTACVFGREPNANDARVITTAELG
jgi:hypothetical protein